MDGDQSEGKDLLDPGDPLAGKERLETEHIQGISDSGDWGDESITGMELGSGAGEPEEARGKEGSEKSEIVQAAPSSSSVEQDSGNPGS